MNIYERNKIVFDETREISIKQLIEATNNMRSNVKVYTNPLGGVVENEHRDMKVEFNRNDTISTTIDLISQGYHVCALNFADAVIPGGLVFQGEITQEEDLCRCSNLYESLIEPKCIDAYYSYNSDLRSCKYSDRIIYSKDVAIIRESSEYKLLDKPLLCDILTCPAPVATMGEKEYMSIITQRIRGILNIMSANGADALVLGAWGCGAFRGDARIVGKVFADALKEFKNFDLVVFSIKSTKNDYKDNFELFRGGFYNAD